MQTALLLSASVTLLTNLAAILRPTLKKIVVRDGVELHYEEYENTPLLPIYPTVPQPSQNLTKDTLHRRKRTGGDFPGYREAAGLELIGQTRAYLP
jgi:hypothetical protein